MNSFWFLYIVIFINVVDSEKVKQIWTSVSGPLKITVNRTTLEDSKLNNENEEPMSNQSSSDSIMKSSQLKNFHATNSSDKIFHTGVGNILCNFIKLMITSQSSKLNDLSEMRSRGKQATHTKMTSAVTAAIVSGGFMTLITLAVLSAMAGKALVASLLALGLSALSLWQNGIAPNNFNQPNTFEIIAKPVYKPASHHTQQDYYYEPPH